MSDQSSGFCSRCGTSLQADAKFCHACGATVQKLPVISPSTRQQASKVASKEYVILGIIIALVSLMGLWAYLVNHSQMESKPNGNFAARPSAPPIVGGTAESATPEIRKAKPVQLTNAGKITTATAGFQESSDNAWVYRAFRDKLGKGKIRVARLFSLNDVNFGFPYSGSQPMRLAVRFDDGPVQKFTLHAADDGSGNAAFVSGYDQFVNKLRKAKTLKIEAPFYQEGTHIFEFDVHGLDWRKTDEAIVDGLP